MPRQKKDDNEKPKKKPAAKKTTKKKTDGRKKKSSEPFGKDFLDIINQIDATIPANVDGLITKEEAEKIAMAKYQELILENSKDLEPTEKFVAEQMANGKTMEMINIEYGVPLNQINSMLQNPLFVKYMNDKIMSTGVADKMQRVIISKGILDALTTKIREKITNGELNDMKIMQLYQLYQQESTLISKLMGEDKQTKDVNVDINVKLIDHLQKNAGKDVDLKSYNPDDDFPVIDVNVEELND